MAEVVEVEPFVSRHQCNRCGDCCESIWFNGTKKDLRKRLSEDGENFAKWALDARFILKHWTRIGGRGKNQRFACDMFDSKTRLCMAHDERPPVCIGYPWYGKEPDSTKAEFHIPSQCSFWFDIPKVKRPVGAVPVSLRRRKEITAG